MSEHVKRGAELYENRPIEYVAADGDGIYAVWKCTECGEKLELRQRDGRHAYTEIGCGCGAASLDLRIADLLDLDIEAWDTETVMGREETE